MPIGVNIGKTKVTPQDGAVDDYAESARLVTLLRSVLESTSEGILVVDLA